MTSISSCRLLQSHIEVGATQSKASVAFVVSVRITGRSRCSIAIRHLPLGDVVEDGLKLWGPQCHSERLAAAKWNTQKCKLIGKLSTLERNSTQNLSLNFVFALLWKCTCQVMTLSVIVVLSMVVDGQPSS